MSTTACCYCNKSIASNAYEEHLLKCRTNQVWICSRCTCKENDSFSSSCTSCGYQRQSTELTGASMEDINNVNNNNNNNMAFGTERGIILESNQKCEMCYNRTGMILSCNHSICKVDYITHIYV